MTIEDKAKPGGPDPKPPGGPSDDPNTAELEALKKSKDRILSEKKKLQAENDANKAKLLEFEDKERDEKQKALEEKGDYEKALELERNKTKVATEKLGAVTGRLKEGEKLSAFLKAVNGTVDEKFWGLIDLTKVIQSDDGVIDKDSVNTAVATFTESFGNELIRKKGTADLPTDAPSGDDPPTNAIKYVDWLKLPPKEMKQRSKDVVD